jgi:hypothetical protein
LKCYVHPKLDAVGVCSVCGRGVCKSCAHFVGGKLYCKEDIEKLVLKEETQAVQRRGFSITTASIFAYLDGAAGMGAGFVLIIVGIIGQSQQSSSLLAALQPLLRYFSALSSSPGPLITNLGLLVLILGSADIIAGYYLWQRSKAAAITSVAISIAGAVLVVIYLGMTPTPTLIASLYLVTAVVKGSAVAAGRKHLR